MKMMKEKKMKKKTGFSTELIWCNKKKVEIQVEEYLKQPHLNLR